jgi:hypothetical protein
VKEALNTILLPMYGASAAGLEFDFVNPVPEDDEISAQVLLNKAQSAKFLADTGLWEAADILMAVGLPEMKELPEPRQPVESTPPVVPAGQEEVRRQENEPSPPEKNPDKPGPTESDNIISWLYS